MRKISLRALGAMLIWCASWSCPAATNELVSLPPAVAQGDLPIPLHPHARSFVDNTGSRRIAEVSAGGETLGWKQRRMEQTDRIDGKALWIEFDVQPREPGSWFVVVGAAGIDHVELYHRNAAGAWVVQRAGSAQPLSTWPVPGRYPTLRLDTTQATRYWMRIENSRLDFAAPLELYSEHALLAKRNRDQFLLGAYFGITALLALAALVSGIVYRDHAFRAFAAYLTVVCGSQLARVGIGAELIWPDWPYWNDVAVHAWPGLPAAAALWFVRVVTEPARLARSLDVAIMGLGAALLVAVAASAVLGTRGAMVMVLSLTGLSLAAVTGTLLWGWTDGRDREVRLIALAFLPVLILALFPLARAFNLVPVSTLTRNAIIYGTILQAPILYYVLQIRSMRRREGEVRAAALSHTDALTGLPHRPAFLERLNTTLTRARNHKQNFALLGVRVANVEAIAGEFGRDTLDKALVVAASHLRRVVSDIDMVARVAEHDFALLLEGPIDSALAVSRAQQVVASGLRQAEALPVAATLKFHVTVGLMPHHSLDGLATLQWMQESLNQITPDAKKAIRPLNF